MKIGIIGAGNMGSALAKGLVDTEIVDRNKIMISDIDEKKLENLSNLGIRSTGNNDEVVEHSEVIFLAIEPSHVKEVLEELDIGKEKLLISIVAGVPIEFIENQIEARVIRAMPNICANVGEMASAYTRGDRATDDDIETVKELLGSLGTTVEVSENLMDAVTGMSGSGPAYAFMIIQALTEVGEELGLHRKDARKLAAQTLKGGSEMVLESEKSLDDLIDSVCSPKGTTIEGVKVLKEKKAQQSLREAVKAATKRSEELSK